MPRIEGFEQSKRPGKTARWLQRGLLERRYGMPPGVLRDIDLRDIGFAATERVWDHIPSPWGVLGRILRPGDITREDVFIDIGCGMGAAVVEAAARYDFRRVIGIDVVPEFTQVARETIARARDRGRLLCQDIEVVTGDVIEYDLPDDVTVAYLYDPFREHAFDDFVAKLVASVDRNPRLLRIIYYMPVEAGRLERSGRAHLVRYGRRRSWSRATTNELAMYLIEPMRGGVIPSPRLSVPRHRMRRSLLPKRFGGKRSPDGVGPDRDEERQARLGLTNSAHSGNSSPASTLVSTGSIRDLGSLRAAFEQHHCVRLDGFLNGPLLERIQRYVNEGGFSVRAHEGMRTERSLDRGRALQFLLFLTNDIDLFELVRTITGCGRIGRFHGGVDRMMPGGDYQDAWHGEIIGTGTVGMSVDLSSARYSGGILEIRDRFSQGILHRAVDGKPGDAVLFRLDPSLQRRVPALEGDVPRTVFEGQFKSDAHSKLVRPGATA
jgi:Methyltransferase domain